MRKTIDVVTMGCSKNLVDSERVIKMFEDVGFSVRHNADNFGGDIVVINTCGFIGDAKEESIQAILEAVERKKQGKIGKIFVFGCLSQRYSTEMPDLIPEVDGWFGARDIAPVVNALGSKMNPERR